MFFFFQQLIILESMLLLVDYKENLRPLLCTENCIEFPSALYVYTH